LFTDDPKGGKPSVDNSVAAVDGSGADPPPGPLLVHDALFYRDEEEYSPEPCVLRVTRSRPACDLGGGARSARGRVSTNSAATRDRVRFWT
jgi:hypothetical protein